MSSADRKGLNAPFLCLLILIVAAGCGGKKEEPAHAGQTAGDMPPNPHIAPVELAEGEVQKAGLIFTLPERWVSEHPSSSMRLGQYRLPSGEEGTVDGEVTLFHFGPGQGGDVNSNLSRWAGQFQQEDGSNGIDRAGIDHFESNGLQIHTIELNGRYVSNMPGGARSYNEPGWRLIGGIIEGKGGPWFFKGVGPEKAIRRAEEEFAGLLHSARVG